MNDYKPLFPYFGGKSTVAGLVWQRFGNPCNYVEPFFGSGAVMFNRPDGWTGIETVNDADGFIANVWRAIKAAPGEVAKHADNPVNECDLHARHLWLVGQRDRITERLCGDPEFFDAKAAGWWIWGACCWIGNGWCSGRGPWTSVDGVMTLTGGGKGQGVKRQLPHLSCAGQGVWRQMPHLAGAGQGVNRQRQRPADLIAEFSARLANVRVCCGDWERVCGPCVTVSHGTTAVFLDPPYADTAGRDSRIYAVDCLSVAHRVREWAIENGTNPLMRICLAGYEGEHAMPAEWEAVAWKAHGGYGVQGEGAGRENAARERLWFSPACVQEDAGLFGVKP